jgi:C-terminal processing protease CtpA/Prc
VRRFVLFGLALACFAASAQPTLDPARVNCALGFESGIYEKLPASWFSVGPASRDRENARSGRAAARIDRDFDSAGEFTPFSIGIPIEFEGSTVEYRGHLRTRDVAGNASLWLRQDGPDRELTLANTRQQRVDGTRGWNEYRVQAPLEPGARRLIVGVLLEGTGTVWVDDIEILVDGEPLYGASRAACKASILERDTEFATGSGIAVTGLSRTQVENLTVLARVWGFLKYHHPRVTSGELHWDFELFRVLPAVLAATDAQARNGALVAWVRHIGVPESCDLGTELSAYLTHVYRNRAARGGQFYATARRNDGDTTFDSELAYETLETPDAGYRLLGLFRHWNIIEYWFPYRDVIGEPWPSVLSDLVPVFAAAETREHYALGLARLVARINDAHAILRRADVLPPRGDCSVAVGLRFIEGAATVAAYAHETRGPETGLRIGDVITAVDSVPVARLASGRAIYYSASNLAGKQLRIATRLLRGPCGPAELTVVRGAERLDLSVTRLPLEQLDVYAAWTRDRPGATFQWLTDDVAYLKLSDIREANVKGYLEQARRARGLVVDIRNYPGEAVLDGLGGRLVREPTVFAQITEPDFDNPGTFVWTVPPTLEPLTPHFGGRIVVLVDDTTISHAEFTAMAFRATPNAIVVGSTTAGADGDVSPMPLPGGFETAISGKGVFYPDRSPTQRVGIVPDIVVTPTIAGIRAGRDEVLERAIREIVGASRSDTQH